MIDDRFAPAVESGVGLAPPNAATGPAPSGSDAQLDDDLLPPPLPSLDQRGSPPGSTAPPALAAPTHSICEADVRYWFG
jgi:hypothetical protein